MKPAAARSVFWAGLEAAVSGALSFAGAFVVARLIGPSEFGIGAAAVAVHVLLWVAINALFSDALVQRSTLDDTAASSAFWASTMVGVLGAALQAGAGWLLADVLSDSRLLAMCLVLAPPLPLVGAGGVVQGLLMRRRAYRALAGRAVIGQGLGTAAGIVAAFAGAGAWAPVLQQAVGSAGGAMTLLLRADWRPRLVCRWRPVWALLRVGVPLTASTMLLAARYRVFAVLLGGTAGPTALGETHMAFRLVETVRELSFTALWRLTLPVLADRQHDRLALRQAVDRLLALTSKAMLPLCGALALGLPPLVRVMLGPAWQPAATAALPLVGLMAMLALMFPSGVAAVARGQAGRTLAGNVACTMLTLLGMLLLRPADPLDAALVWLGAQVLVTPYSLWVNGRAVDAGLLRPLRAGLPMLGVTLLALGVALLVPPLVGMAIRPITVAVMRLAVFAGVCGAAVLFSTMAHEQKTSAATREGVSLDGGSV